MEKEEKITNIEQKVVLLEKAQKKFSFYARLINFIITLLCLKMTYDIFQHNSSQGEGILFFILVMIMVLMTQVKNIIDITLYLFKEFRDIV